MREDFHGDLGQLGSDLATMCGLAADAMERAARALTTADLDLAEQVINDDQIDALQRRLLTAAVRRGDGPDAVRLGIDVALLTRYVERFADQAVSLARQLDYLVTGAVPDRTTP